MTSALIAVYASSLELQPLASRLAESLNLPFVATPEHHYEYLLCLTPGYLGIKKTTDNAAPISVNFLSDKIQYRLKHLSLKKESLARALGLNHRTPPTIVDATGGLLRDSFILAALGFSVTALERSAIIHALVKDGLMRASAHPDLQAIISRLTFIHDDAISWLTTRQESERPDMVYLDPMFPGRKKTALPKQEMVIFQDIVGKDEDSTELFYAALACAKKRVVVKRPRLAECLAATPLPSFSFKGTSSRFDVYLT